MDGAIRQDETGGTQAAEGASGYLDIDLGALARNYEKLAAEVAPARAAAVVKADAYGLGAAQVAPALYRAGCRHFFVAHLDEGIALRPLLAPDATVYVLHGATPGAEPECVTHGLVPVLNSLQQLDAWRRLAQGLDRELPAVLQVDTGMSRLGLPPDELDTVAADPARLQG
ncbi:MAG TPA: alanine racemase, partial [Shinella sp.]|nr:alanine racemase [Shinella sp.]